MLKINKIESVPKPMYRIPYDDFFSFINPSSKEVIDSPFI